MILRYDYVPSDLIVLNIADPVRYTVHEKTIKILSKICFFAVILRSFNLISEE